MPDKKPLQEDDERVIADMNVEGMPWYHKANPTPKAENPEPISNKNLWRYTFSAVGAGLLVVFTFGLAAAAFIWFCVNVWFK